MENKKTRYAPFILGLLVFSLIFLALGGLYGGIAMLLDPTGSMLKMTEILPLLHVPNYTLPGLFLFFVMGLIPLFLTYGLLYRPNWSWCEILFCWSGYHWAWTGTLALGMMLVIWLIIQGFLIGFKWPIQYVTAIDGFLIILLLLMPKARRLYAK